MNLHNFVWEYEQEIGWATVILLISAMVLFAIGIVFDEADWLSVGNRFLYLMILVTVLVLCAGTMFFGLIYFG